MLLYTDGSLQHYSSGYYTVLDARHLVFWVTASRDARVAVSAVAGVTAASAVEVLIGINDNTRHAASAFFVLSETRELSLTPAI